METLSQMNKYDILHKMVMMFGFKFQTIGYCEMSSFTIIIHRSMQKRLDDLYCQVSLCLE